MFSVVDVPFAEFTATGHVRPLEVAEMFTDVTAIVVLNEYAGSGSRLSVVIAPRAMLNDAGSPGLPFTQLIWSDPSQDAGTLNGVGVMNSTAETTVVLAIGIDSRALTSDFVGASSAHAAIIARKAIVAADPL